MAADYNVQHQLNIHFSEHLYIKFTQWEAKVLGLAKSKDTGEPLKNLSVSIWAYMYALHSVDYRKSKIN